MRSLEKEQELNQLDNVIVPRLDVTDPASIKEAVKLTVDKFSSLDVLVNNAGYGGHAVLEQAHRTGAVKRVVATSSCAAIYGDNADSGRPQMASSRKRSGTRVLRSGIRHTPTQKRSQSRTTCGNTTATRIGPCVRSSMDSSAGTTAIRRICFHSIRARNPSDLLNSPEATQGLVIEQPRG